MTDIKYLLTEYVLEKGISDIIIGYKQDMEDYDNIKRQKQKCMRQLKFNNLKRKKQFKCVYIPSDQYLNPNQLLIYGKNNRTIRILESNNFYKDVPGYKTVFVSQYRM